MITAAEYHQRLTVLGAPGLTSRPLGLRMCWGPFVTTRLITASKPAS